MKHRLFVLLLLMLSFTAHSQRLSFCESVTEKGDPVNPSNYFVIGEKGGFFKVLIRLEKPVESSQITFDVFMLQETGKEIFDNTIRMNIAPELTWFYKEITFYKEGKYNVYCYDEKNRLLGAGIVEIRKK